MVDIDVIHALSEAMGGDLAFVKGMLAEFIAEAKEQIESAEKAYKLNDCQGVQYELHTLKGNSGTLGASQVHEMCEKIETKAKVCDFTNFEEEIILLTSALHKFEIKIENKGGSSFTAKIYMIIADITTGKEMKEPAASRTLLPNQIKTVDYSTTKKLAPGDYAVAVILDYSSVMPLEIIQQNIVIE